MKWSYLIIICIIGALINIVVPNELKYLWGYIVGGIAVISFNMIDD